MFAFESSPHSSDLLRRLDELRRRELLCDVTVVVEGRRFAAHRCVLAACCHFFAHRTGREEEVVELPREVSAAGFEPLLKFAYTSKLLFDRENILDIRNSASHLGFYDLEQACFDFLRPRSGTSGKKSCCEKKCRLSRGDAVNPEAEERVAEEASAPEGYSEEAGSGEEVAEKKKESVGEEVEISGQCSFKVAGPGERTMGEVHERNQKEADQDQRSSRSTERCCLGRNPQELPSSHKETSCVKDGSARGSAEQEVAEHLASRLGSDLIRDGSGGPAEAPGCPFLSDERGFWMSEVEGASQSMASSLASGDDGDDSETEGESDARERARQVQLPFAVDWIVGLDRNEFQQLLKQQLLTHEQQDLVHDLRRRSKNRLAAQRCRKRKLDCIFNLQCEINKLRCEREKLMHEKNQLNQMKVKTCRGVSSLCERICEEAALEPEQLQVLTKFSSSECPLFPHLDSHDLLTSRSGCQEWTPGGAPDSPETPHDS